MIVESRLYSVGATTDVAVDNKFLLRTFGRVNEKLIFLTTACAKKVLFHGLNIRLPFFCCQGSAKKESRPKKPALAEIIKMDT